MSKIQAVARFKIHPGKLVEFRRLSGNCMRLSRDNDPARCVANIFLNADETQCVVCEEYVDAPAQHFENMGAAAIFAIVDMEGEIRGDPGPEPPPSCTA